MISIVKNNLNLVLLHYYSTLLVLLTSYSSFFLIILKVHCAAIGYELFVTECYATVCISMINKLHTR